MGFSYESVANIVSDAAVELGLGSVSDVFGSTDANIIQLRTLLKSAGRKLVLDYDWEHLIKEFSLVTWPNWKPSTTYIAVAPAWSSGTVYSVGDYITNFGNLYQCTVAGTAVNKVGAVGPSGIGTAIHDGATLIWTFVNTGSSSIVTHGSYYYTMQGPPTGVSLFSGTIGPVAPSAANGPEVDGGVSWLWSGVAADYALPADFSNLSDQTGWNRTNRLPVGGPVDGQSWQYLKGRQQGVVFNVLFRPVDGLLRLYPDKDTPGGFNIVFEYISGSWVGPTGGTTATTDAPTANTDIIYFSPLLMLHRIKRDWLQSKGFDTALAQRAYDDTLSAIISASGSAEVLNLRGRTAFSPMLSPTNVPITGFGS